MKKGFVFIETLIVLIVLCVSLVSLYSMYVKVSSDVELRKYFDNISDLYKTDIIRGLVNESSLNTGSELIVINSSNCTSYMNSQCRNVFDSLNVINVYINTQDINAILASNTIKLNNSMVQYLRTINREKNERFIIVNFKYNSNNYYASLRI